MPTYPNGSLADAQMQIYHYYCVVQYSLSRGSLDFECEDAAPVSFESRWHRPVLRREQSHPLERGAETGESSLLVVMLSALLAHPQ